MIGEPRVRGRAKLLRGLADYVERLSTATPQQIVTIERSGVPGGLPKELARHMDVGSARMFAILGIPKATAEKKAATGEALTGAGGLAAIGMVRLLALTKEMLATSTSSEAKGFDCAKWLGRWIERPQPSLGGRAPAEFLDTPTGVEIVARLMRSIESGAYQ